MSFRRTLMSTTRNAKRMALAEIDKRIEAIETVSGQEHRREMARDKLAESRWMIMADTAGTPAADPKAVRDWANGDPAKRLDDAMTFLQREADIAGADGPVQSRAYADAVLDELKQVGMRSGDIEAEIGEAAERVHAHLKSEWDGDVAPADILEMPMREICGLDGQTEPRIPQSGDNHLVARMVCRRLATALEAERRPEPEADDDPEPC